MSFINLKVEYVMVSVIDERTGKLTAWFLTKLQVVQGIFSKYPFDSQCMVKGIQSVNSSNGFNLCWVFAYPVDSRRRGQL